MPPWRASAVAVSMLTPTHDSACRLNTPQARCATLSGAAFGPRSKAAATAASCTSRPLGCLPNSVSDIAAMPTSSPRNATEFKYASRISVFFQPVSMRAAVTAWSILPARLRPLPGRARPSSIRPASCIVSVDAPRVRVFHRLPQALPATALQSTPLCS